MGALAGGHSISAYRINRGAIISIAFKVKQAVYSHGK